MFTNTSSSMSCLKKKNNNDKENKRKLAIRNLSLAVNTGDVLGLLGHNGAGKTTTMRIITMEEKETTGKVWKKFKYFVFPYLIIRFCSKTLKVFIKGHELRESTDIAFRMIGYCPQHDALWSTLTIREHLNVYATIRGITKNQIQK